MDENFVTSISRQDMTKILRYSAHSFITHEFPDKPEFEEKPIDQIDDDALSFLRPGEEKKEVKPIVDTTNFVKPTYSVMKAKISMKPTTIKNPKPTFAPRELNPKTKPDPMEVEKPIKNQGALGLEYSGSDSDEKPEPEFKNNWEAQNKNMAEIRDAICEGE